MSKGRPSLSIMDTVDLIREQKYCCAVCKEELWIKYQGPDANFRKERLAGIDSNNREALYRLPLHELNLHHKLPRSAGGSGSENVEIVCEDCTETSQKSITLPNSIWKMLDDYNREIYADDEGNVGMSRGRRLREIIMLHLHSLDSEE